jgi:hypothetical protein
MVGARAEVDDRLDEQRQDATRLDACEARRAQRECPRQAGVVRRRETAHPGASQGGRERASFRPDAGKGRRARGQGLNLPQRRASPDRAGLAVRRGEGRPRDRCRVRSDASGSPRAADDRLRGGGLAPGGAPRVAIRSPRRRQRPSPRGARRSQLLFGADECAVVRAHAASVAAPRTRPTRQCPARASRKSRLRSPKPHGDLLEEFRFPFGRTGIDRRRDVSRQ